MIPKIIHQIAPENRSDWHPIWAQCHESWINNFPDFEIKLYNDKEDIEDFVKQNYNEYYSLFKKLPYDIMRINFARYCLLHYYGGIYADMDVYCYKNFYEIINHKPLWFNENKFCEFVDRRYKIENCLIASSAKNYFWKDCLEVCKERFFTLHHLFQKSNIDRDWLIIHLTDADLFEQSKDAYNPEQINFFPAELFNNRSDVNDSSLYTKHFHTSMWVDKKQ